MRIRPIFMTALTTILGLSTMAAGVGSGSEMSQPMAVVTIGGLLYGTLLTLVVIPCIYSLFMREKREDRGRRRAGMFQKMKRNLPKIPKLPDLKLPKFPKKKNDRLE